MSKDMGMLRSAFTEVAESLLNGVHEVFPECRETCAALEALRTFVIGNEESEHLMITTFGNSVKQRKDFVKNRDSEFLFGAIDSIPVLKNLNIRSKWSDADFDDASKEHFWMYIGILTAYAKVYTSVPNEILKRVEESMSGLIHDANPADMMNIIQTISKTFPSTDIGNHDMDEENIRDAISSLTEVMAVQMPGFSLNTIMDQLQLQAD
jgi:hypothetical protein